LFIYLIINKIKTKEKQILIFPEWYQSDQLVLRICKPAFLPGRK